MVGNARAERPPAIDVRGAVRAALLAESVRDATPSWSEALLELFDLRWVRVSLAGGLAAAVLLCVSGWQMFSRELSDPIALALQQEPLALFAASAP